MTVEVQDSPLEVKTERSGQRVLALMALYLALAVSVGVVRNELQSAHSTPAHQTVLSQAGATPDTDKMN